MPRPSDMVLLQAWEEGLAQHPVDRALTLLAACSGEPRDRLASLSIGERDAALLRARMELFGESLPAYAECPRCGERLEFELPAPGLLSQTALPDTEPEFRLPDSHDLAAIAGCEEVVGAERLLLQRCVPQADRMSEQELQAALRLMAEFQPAAAAETALTCPACEMRWDLALDVESFFWTELGVWARRRLREVDALARAYGWSEEQVLSLSPLRRRIYVEMVS